MAAVAAIRPTAPSPNCSRKTVRGSRREGLLSLLPCKALKLPPAIRVEAGHLPGEVAERGVAVLLDERVDTGLRAKIGVFLARVRGRVQVGLALAPARNEPLGVQAAQDRHVGGVRARLLGSAVESLPHLAHRHLPIAVPNVLHDLGLELVKLRRDLWLRTHTTECSRCGEVTHYLLLSVVLCPCHESTSPHSHCRRARRGCRGYRSGLERNILCRSTEDGARSRAARPPRTDAVPVRARQAQQQQVDERLLAGLACVDDERQAARSRRCER